VIIDYPINPGEYVGFLKSKYILLKKKKDICCLRLDQLCEHNIKSGITTGLNKCVIVATEKATNQLMNFIYPLRGQALKANHINSIVFLFSEK
jgi:hypothetical protein